LWTIMGSAIVLLWVATVIVAVLLLREPIADRALALGIRLGLVVALLGMAVAFFMGAPRPAQQDALALGQTTLSGAHAVGVPDGGPGVPVTGWSTTGGDLRVPHFIGLHALQEAVSWIEAAREVWADRLDRLDAHLQPAHRP